MIRAALVAMVLAGSAVAHAYEPIACSWGITGYSSSSYCPYGDRDTDPCGCGASVAPVWFGGQVSFAIENQGGSGVTASEFVGAAQYAADAWSDVSCSSLNVDASTVIPATAGSAPWGLNSSVQGVYYVTTTTEWVDLTGSGGNGVLGVTLPGWYGSTCGNRDFADADIIINGHNVTWSINSLASTILHEMGHAVGLGHPCLSTFSSCSNSCQAVMAATGADYVVPQQDDVNGVCALYPGTPGGLGASCDDISDCTVGPCIVAGGFEYCSQACSGSSCPEGWTCRYNAGAGQNVCERKTGPSVGESCTGSCEEGAVCVGVPGGGATCFLECTSSTECGSGESCIDIGSGVSICWEEGTKLEGEICSGAGECSPGLICVPDGSSARCKQACDFNNEDSCLNPNKVCVPLVDGSGNPVAGACFNRGSGTEGSSCDFLADCAAGFSCIATGSSGTCLAQCHNTGNCCVYDGQACLGISGSSVRICSPAKSGPPDRVCEDCFCNTSNACDPGCSSCDPDCTCSCDTTSACDSDGQGDCSCDPQCENACTCDTSSQCNTGCACDTDCEFAGCGPENGCTCDITTACDPELEGCTGTSCADCPCDCECPCACDVTTDIDPYCPCDPDEGDSGCSCTSEEPMVPLALMAAVLGLRLVRRRRGLRR